MSRKKHLLVITQNVDESDDLLGFFVTWLREFARHFDAVSVITLAAGAYELPSNVHVYSLGKEHGTRKWRQAIRFLRLLYTFTPRHGAVFAHMSPIFAVAAWPFTVLRRARLALWYLHRSRTMRLRLALALCDVLLTADTASLTIQSPKMRAVGHGIDTARFAVPGRQSPNGRSLHILSVGRLAPIKDFSTLIRAGAILRDRGISMHIRIVGRALTGAHRREEKRLHALVRSLKVGEIVSFFGFVPYREMPEQYAWADVIVGCTPRGGLDKAILEGMAAGCIPLTSNDVMRSHLQGWAEQLLFSVGDEIQLSEKIANLENWDMISHDVVTLVRHEHDVVRTIHQITTYL